MKKIFLFVLLATGALRAGATAIRIPLQKAIAGRQLEVSIRSQGLYCGKGLHLKIYNPSATEYIVEVPTGLIFKPDDAQYQPLAIAGAQEMHIRPGGVDSQLLQTFCAHSSAHSPAKGVNYTFLQVAPPMLMHVLEYMQANNFMDYTGQHAVWAITDDHATGGVYDFQRPGDSKKFAAFVARQKGLESPQFYYIYREHIAGDGPVFVPVAVKAVVELEWNDRDARIMTCEVVREDGTLYREVPGPEFITAGGQHRMHTVFDLNSTPPGVYYVRARDEMNRVWEEHKVTVV